jgi:hypothetical protein
LTIERMAAVVWPVPMTVPSRPGDTMGTPLTSAQTKPLEPQLDDLRQQLKELKDKVEKNEPGSNKKTSIIEVIMKKTLLLDKMKAAIDSGDVAAETVDEWTQQWLDNIDILGDIATKVAVGVALVVKKVLEQFEKIGKGVAAVFEKSDGTGTSHASADGKTLKVNGATKNMIVEPGDALKALGAPASLGPAQGTWAATLQFDGTDASGGKRYRVTEYEAVIGDFAFGPKTLKAVTQSLNVERASSAVVGTDGTLTATLYTRLRSESWSEDDNELGAPCTTTLTGKATGETFAYHSESADILSAALIFPEAAAAPRVFLPRAIEHVGTVVLPANTLLFDATGKSVSVGTVALSLADAATKLGFKDVPSLATANKEVPVSLGSLLG